MTQMLLFEATAGPSETTTLLAEPPAREHRQSEPVDSEPANVAAALEHDSGLHHMGDLARLVLLRYELVAKRRAAMAKRKAARV